VLLYVGLTRAKVDEEETARALEGHQLLGHASQDEVRAVEDAHTT
jgi:hydrogenase maturation factor